MKRDDTMMFIGWLWRPAAPSELKNGVSVATQLRLLKLFSEGLGLI